MTERPRAAGWNVRATRLALAVALAAVALQPRAARAHGGGPAVFAAAGTLLLAPAPGVEWVPAEGGARTLLAWPFQFGLDRTVLDLDGAASRHRLVVSPELTLDHGAEFRARAGYRWVSRPVFAGLGVSACRSLGASAVPELGYRWWQTESGANAYVTARADVAVLPRHAGAWASSLSVGLAFF